MTDNFNSDYSFPIADYSDKEELTEKPYYDDNSAPEQKSNSNQNYTNNNYDMENNKICQIIIFRMITE